MKKLGADEIFILSAIADKIGDLKFPERTKWIDKDDYIQPVLTKEEKAAGKELPKVVFKGDKVRVPKTDTEYGIEAFLVVFRKIYLVEAEVRKLISTVTGKDSKELSLKELADAFKGLLESEGIMDFFKSANS